MRIITWLAPVLMLCLMVPCGLKAQSSNGQVITETIVSGLSQSRVAITADFDGDEILIYGAVKRDGPAPDGALEVIVTVDGPSGPVTVRRKEKIMGIWVNHAALNIGRAPVFYAVASTGPLAQILSPETNQRYSISIERAIRAIGLTQNSESESTEDFLRALVRVRTDEGRYRLLENAIEFTEDTLFRADIALPANLTEGTYRVRLFLLRDGDVVAQQTREIDVHKEGLERMVYNLSHEQPLLYGILSLLMAVVAGWGASALFRFVRP